MLKSLMKPCAVIVILLLGVAGAIWIKDYVALSETSFMGLVVISAVFSIVLPHLNNIKSLSFAKGEIILNEVQASEKAVRELAIATAELLDASIEHSILDGGFNQERYDSARAKLNSLQK